MKKIVTLIPAKTLLVLVLATLALAGCVPPWKTQPSLTAGWPPEHESWCYKTLAEVDCYARPQNTAADRLVGVDPPARQPKNAREHGKAVATGGD